ncbi:MAG: hypothetical protein J7M17_08265 [Anaerolineae bacterium]|nr:hypothetical protein [Anaerolineae bacterium]
MGSIPVLRSDARFIGLALFTGRGYVALAFMPGHSGVCGCRHILSAELVERRLALMEEIIAYLLNNPGRLEPVLLFSSCGRSPDRATGGHGRETGPSCPQILRRYIIALLCSTINQRQLRRRS